MDETPDVATLVAGLVSSSESARKYAVFKLQGLLADPSFADAFIQANGLPALHSCVLESSGNAQAYALGSLLVLLELDVGWEVVDAEVVEKVSYKGEYIYMHTTGKIAGRRPRADHIPHHHRP
jgi:engulfment/cell motility protein 1